MDCGESAEDADECGDFGAGAASDSDAGEEACGFGRFDDSGDELGEEPYQLDKDGGAFAMYDADQIEGESAETVAAAAALDALLFPPAAW